MRSDEVVLFEPLVDDGLGMPGCCKPLGVEYFTTQSSIKALFVSVLPGLAGINIDRLDADLGQPVLEGFGCN